MMEKRNINRKIKRKKKKIDGSESKQNHKSVQLSEKIEERLLNRWQ